MLTRKWGASGENVAASMARIVEKIDVGGAGLADLTSGFDAMAGNAAAAGLGGEAGLTKLLGIIKILDNKMGTESITAMKTFFENFKEGSALVKDFEKKAKIKFDFNMDAFDQLAAIMEADKGMAVAAEKFTGPIGVMFDELSMPFKVAVKEAMAAGLSAKTAREKGIEAFKASMKGASESSLTFAELQKKAAQRMLDDPTIKMNMALDKIRMAFGQPKMLKAIDSIAEKLPVMAEKLVEFIDWVVDNPWKAAATMGGAKVGLDVAGAGIGAGMAAIGKKILGKFGIGKAATTAATTATTAATTGGTLAGAGLGAMAAAGTAGAAIGGAVGYGIHKLVLDPQAQAAFAKMEESSGATIAAMNAMQTNDVGLKVAALKSLQEKRKNLPGTFSSVENVMGALASAVTDVKHPMQLRAEHSEANLKMQQELIASMAKQTDGVKFSSDKVQQFSNDLVRASNALKKLVPSTPTGAAKGPKDVPQRAGNQSVPG